MSRTMIQAPRTTGEVVAPLVVTFKMAACVSKPPSGLFFGSVTFCIAEPLRGGS